MQPVSTVLAILRSLRKLAIGSQYCQKVKYRRAPYNASAGPQMPSSSILDEVRRFERELAAAIAFHKSQRRRVVRDFSSRMKIVEAFDVETFLDFANNRLTEVDASRATFLFLDFKLQVATILLFDWDYLNEQVYRYSPRDSARVTAGQSEYQRFLLYSFHHAEISKIRVAFERLMNLVVFVETGRLPEGGKSKKGTFGRFLDDHARWQFLRPLMQTIGDFDDRFRTPEVHKASTLRRILFHGGSSDELSAITSAFLCLVNALLPNFREALSNWKV